MCEANALPLTPQQTALGSKDVNTIKCNAPILTNNSILDAYKYSEQNLSNAEAGLDRKEEKVTNRIFREF